MRKFSFVPAEEFCERIEEFIGKDGIEYQGNLYKIFPNVHDIAMHWYVNLKKPVRASSQSAGYDFCIPFDCIIPAGQEQVIPTGICAHMESNNVLLCVPRSGLGFKYGLKLKNTLGVIDADYINSRNGGHILLKLVNPSADEPIVFKMGDRIAQGIFMEYLVTYDDDVNTERTGGFGSTGN